MYTLVIWLVQLSQDLEVEPFPDRMGGPNVVRIELVVPLIAVE